MYYSTLENAFNELMKFTAAFVTMALGFIAMLAVTGAVVAVFPPVAFLFLVALLPVAIAGLFSSASAARKAQE